MNLRIDLTGRIDVFHHVVSDAAMTAEEQAAAAHRLRKDAGQVSEANVGLADTINNLSTVGTETKEP